MTATDPSPPTVSEIRRQGGARGTIAFLGPAFVAAIAYVDPGNFATNFSAGASYGFLLLWVIIAANLVAMLVQTLTAKLGMATGRDLPEMCRDTFPRPVSRLMWVQAELVAIATDLAEVIGGAIALNLLFGIPLFTGGLITGVVAFALLALQRRGYRPFELAIVGLLGVILLGFFTTVLRIDVPVGSLAKGLVPRFEGTQSLLLATGILGATVMPHVIYLHSALTQKRIVGATPWARRKIFRFELVDVMIAMGVAGIINMAMLTTAAAVFHSRGLVNVGTNLNQVYHGLDQYLGAHSGLIFGIALLASGVSSSCVGTLAGQVVMQGFIHRQIPIFLRRAITMTPALILLAVGYDPSRALVLSQVFLSFGIPFALIPLVLFCRNPTLMGTLVNRRLTTRTAYAVTATIIILNMFLLYQTLL